MLTKKALTFICKVLPTTLIVILCFCKQVVAQDSTYKTARPAFVQATLLYDFPQSLGLIAGIDFPFKSIIKRGFTKSGAPKSRQKDFFFGVNVGAYRYPSNYTGVLLVPTIGVRHYKNAAFFTEASLGEGILRTFYDGKVYKLDASGTVQEVPLSGRFYATTHLSYAFNWQLQKQDHNIFVFQVKPSLWVQYPFNSTVKPHLSLEAGIKYQFSTANIKTKKITKHHGK